VGIDSPSDKSFDIPFCFIFLKFIKINDLYWTFFCISLHEEIFKFMRRREMKSWLIDIRMALLFGGFFSALSFSLMTACGQGLQGESSSRVRDLSAFFKDQSGDTFLLEAELSGDGKRESSDVHVVSLDEDVESEDLEESGEESDAEGDDVENPEDSEDNDEIEGSTPEATVHQAKEDAGIGHAEAHRGSEEKFRDDVRSKARTLGTATFLNTLEVGNEIREENMRDYINQRIARNTCHDQVVSLSKKAREVSLDAEMSQLDLPYHSSHPSTDKELQLATIGESNTLRSDRPLVKDMQYVFAFDLVLPLQDQLVSIESFGLTMSGEYGVDQSFDTEMVCFIHERVCSGEAFYARGWAELKNREFWKDLTGSRPGNDFFLRRLIQESPYGKSLKRSSRAFSIHFPIEDLIEGHPQANLTDFLYGLESLEVNGVTHHTIYVSVADDTFIRSAELSVDLQVNPCGSQGRR
jgi:hypothetical protein